MKKLADKLKNRGIMWKLFLYLLGFCVLLLIILWLFQTVFLDSFYRTIKLGQVERDAKELAALLEGGDAEGFEARVKERGDVFVELVDESGNGSMISGFWAELPVDTGGQEEKAQLYAQAVQNGGAFSARYDSDVNFTDSPEWAPYRKPEDLPFPKPEGEFDPMRGQRRNETILHAKIVRTAEGEERLLVVTANITPVNATVQTLRVQLFWISGIMLLLAVGLALLIAKRVAKPIEKLNAGAHELSRGNYDVHFEAGGYREISELSATLNQTASELNKTETLRRDLIANVSHDLRTPLTLITGYAEMMRDLPGEDNAENMQVIIDEATRLSTLVRDLMDLSQLQAGTGEMHLERFDLNAEVGSIIARFSKLSEAEGFTVEYRPAGAAVVQGDPRRIGQVVYNFLINAMTHGGADKVIAVRQDIRDGRVRLAVEDHGAGIDAEQLPHIWERYYKVDKVHRRAPAGAGLGLSIVKSILEQHPGMEYGVESAKGQGSSFWFLLPLAPPK